MIEGLTMSLVVNNLNATFNVVDSARFQKVFIGGTVFTMLVRKELYERISVQSHDRENCVKIVHKFNIFHRH